MFFLFGLIRISDSKFSFFGLQAVFGDPETSFAFALFGRPYLCWLIGGLLVIFVFMHNGLPAIEKSGQSSGFWSRHAVALCLLGCMVGIGLSFGQVWLTPRPDIRVNAIKSLYDHRYGNLGDPWPAILAARQLSQNPRALIYNDRQVAGAAYIYPPIAASVYLPVANLNQSRIFSILSLANRLLFVAIYLLLMLFLFYESRPSWKAIVVILVLSVCYYPLLRAVELNQSTVLVTVLLGVTWVSLQRTFHAAAGIALAAAVAIKPQLVLVLPFLILSAPRVIWWTMGTGAILLGLSVWYAGLQNHVYYLTRMVPMLSAGYSFYPNHSFNGLFNRLLLNEPIHIFALAPKTAAVQVLTVVCGLLTYSAALWVARRQRHKSHMALPLFGFAWLCATLVSPVSWEHHYAPALFVFAWIYRQYVNRGHELPAWLLIPTAASFVLVACYFDIFGLHGAIPQLLVSYVFYGGLLLAVVIGLMLEKKTGLSCINYN